MARILHYKLVVGAVLGLLALGVLGGLLVLQLLSVAQGDAAAVQVVVEHDATRLFDDGVTLEEPTALSALEEAARAGGFEVETRLDDQGARYVHRIGAHAAHGAYGWAYCAGDPCLRSASPPDRYALRDGERLLWEWAVVEPGST